MENFNNFKRRFISEKQSNVVDQNVNSSDINEKGMDPEDINHEGIKQSADKGKKILSYQDENEFRNNKLNKNAESLKIDFSSRASEKKSVNLLVYDGIAQKVVPINSDIICQDLVEFKKGLLDLLAENKIGNVFIFGKATEHLFFVFENLFSFIFKNVSMLKYDELSDFCTFEDPESKNIDESKSDSLSNEDISDIAASAVDNGQDNPFQQVYSELSL